MAGRLCKLVYEWHCEWGDSFSTWRTSTRSSSSSEPSTRQDQPRQVRRLPRSSPASCARRRVSRRQRRGDIISARAAGRKQQPYPATKFDEKFRKGGGGSRPSKGRFEICSGWRSSSEELGAKARRSGLVGSEKGSRKSSPSNGGRNWRRRPRTRKSAR